MSDRIEPAQCGTWDVLTFSGAQYRLHVPADGRTTVARVPAGPGLGSGREGSGSTSFQGDERAIEVVTLGSYDQFAGLVPGVQVGLCMVLVLEPLSTAGNAVVRITTPVVEIVEVDPPGTPATR